MKTLKTQQQRDDRIRQIHADAGRYWPKLEEIIDELKALGPHSQDRDNARLNVREKLRDLSQR
jgi:hypothetical protein